MVNLVENCPGLELFLLVMLMMILNEGQLKLNAFDLAYLKAPSEGGLVLKLAPKTNNWLRVFDNVAAKYWTKSHI